MQNKVAASGGVSPTSSSSWPRLAGQRRSFRGSLPTAQSIAHWVAQDARDRGNPLPGKEGLSTAEREALVRLRRQLRQVQQERDTWQRLRPGLPAKA